MRFIHIADVHLGATPDFDMPWGKEREKEIWRSFENIITICNNEKIDLLLIAGDLFHKQPLLRELKELNYLFQKLNNTKVVMVAGNHDYIGARSHYKGFEWSKGVSMIESDSIDTITLPELHTEIYGLSYHTRDIKEALYDTVKPEQNGYIHILLAHGGDERDIPINRKKLQVAGFDYIALGHIHKPEIISDNMAYSGSLEPMDKNEVGERGYILGEITVKPENGFQTMISFVPSSHREYKRVTLTINQDTTNGSLMDQVRETIATCGRQNIYTFTLQGIKGEAISFDKEEILPLGNILEVKDQTVPDYDFEEIVRENGDNIIGMFIQRIRENSKDDEIMNKALYYGIEALLGAQEGK